MIAKAAAISHGVNALRYITGESANKKHPEKIHCIANQYIDPSFGAIAILESMKFSCAGYPRLKNNLIRIEISPAKEYTRDFTDDDWRKLWEEFVKEFDRQEITDERTGKIISPQTHIAHSKATVWLHRDSRSGIPHLHAVVCRIDEDGDINNDHQIHLRAQRAAERIARRRGWTTANDKHYDHIRQTTADCELVLGAMQEWSWEKYVKLLGLKGYEVRERRDSKDVLRGYTLRKDNVIIKASELRGREFMASRLEDTWRKLHAQKNADTTMQKTVRTSMGANTDDSRTMTNQPQQTQSQSNRSASSTSQSPAPSHVQSSMPSATQQSNPNYAIQIDYTQYRAGTIPYTLGHDDKDQHYYIPEKVMELFENEFDYREVANWQELTNLAVALFIGMAGGPATAPSCGGGGGSTNSNWGRDKDEDDLRWARRCAKAATQKLGKQPKYGLRR